MLIAELRLDRLRYVTRTSDVIVSETTLNNFILYKTKSGNILVCIKEPYLPKGDCPEKGQIMDMVQFIITPQQKIVPAKYIEDILNEHDINKTTRLLEIINEYESEI